MTGIRGTRRRSFDNIAIDAPQKPSLIPRLLKGTFYLVFLYATIAAIILTFSTQNLVPKEELTMRAEENSITVVVPTYNEASNIDEFNARLHKVVNKEKSGFNMKLEVIIVDDNSPDGTSKKVANFIQGMEALRKDPSHDPSMDKITTRLITRKNDRGLASAVVEGIKHAKNDVVIVMDADLSHPPEIIHEICFQLLMGKADFAIASRYTEGGKVENWPLTRKIISKGATYLARPLVGIHDPMSGMFALRRSMITKEVYSSLNLLGFKIGLELMVKINPKIIVEVPFTFVDRLHGKSKLKSKVYFEYIQQLISLYTFKFGYLICLAVILIPIFIAMMASQASASTAHHRVKLS